MNPTAETQPGDPSVKGLQISFPSLDEIQQQINRIIVDSVTRNLEEIIQDIALEFKLDESRLRAKYASFSIDLPRQDLPLSGVPTILPPRVRKTRKTVPDEERCIALIGNGKTRCTRHRKAGSELCQTHINSCKYTINTLSTSNANGGEDAMLVSIQGRQMIRHGDRIYQCPEEIGEHIELEQLQQIGEYINDVPKLF